jgi:hypothetical protein
MYGFSYTTDPRRKPRILDTSWCGDVIFDDSIEEWNQSRIDYLLFVTEEPYLMCEFYGREGGIVQGRWDEDGFHPLKGGSVWI